jgi:hypothetical protein
VPIEWPSLSKKVNDPLTYLKIESPTDLSVETSVLESAKFWESLPIMENEKLFPEMKEEL